MTQVAGDMKLQQPNRISAGRTRAPRRPPIPEIALLGGSFNPPHIAHMMAAYWTLATQPVSEVWLLPSYKHPFGKTLAPFTHRVRMCELACEELPRVRVCTAEADLANDPLVGKTARILEHLKAKYPRARFALIVGTDVLNETQNWYRWDRVQQLARIVAIGRAGHSDRRGRVLLPKVSSSAIRGRIARGEDVSELVPARVLQYLTKRCLYV